MSDTIRTPCGRRHGTYRHLPPKELQRAKPFTGGFIPRVIKFWPFERLYFSKWDTQSGWTIHHFSEGFLLYYMPFENLQRIYSAIGFHVIDSIFVGYDGNRIRNAIESGKVPD
jgi:hypothetical protein